MTRIKLCGLFREEDIRMVNRVLPDYCGFVFYDKSHRYVDPERAAELKAMLDKRIKAAGVFVDHDPGEICSLAEKKVIDLIQLHGHEDRDYILGLKERTGAEIIRAFQTGKKTGEELSALIREIEECPADIVLIDSGKGSGRVFDWDLLKDIKRPFFLAGGLNAGNMKEALESVSPYGLDISSGIETEGIKDEKKIREVMKILGRM